MFQKCLECGSDLASKADYSFVLDENDEFHIGESVIDFPESESNKFAGEYHGFFVYFGDRVLFTLLFKKHEKVKSVCNKG